MTTKAYVLMSGGIDSTTCFHLALRDFPNAVTGVSINYGQRHRKEIDYAARNCMMNKADHRVLNLSGIVPRTMLTDPEAKVPDISYQDIKGVSPTYVPFRNGLMLSALTSFVDGQLPKDGSAVIYFGAHAEDAANFAYPDCTGAFAGAMSAAIFIGSYWRIQLVVPLQFLTKAEIIQLGQSLKVNWQDTWSCYKGEDFHCGTCPTCRARRDGFAKAHVDDPTIYQIPGET